MSIKNWLTNLELKQKFGECTTGLASTMSRINVVGMLKRARPFSPDIVIRAGGLDGKTEAVSSCCQVLEAETKKQSWVILLRTL